MTTLREAIIRLSVEFDPVKPPNLDDIARSFEELHDRAADELASISDDVPPIDVPLSFDKHALDTLKGHLEDIGGSFNVDAATAEFERLQAEGLSAADALAQAFANLPDSIEPINVPLAFDEDKLDVLRQRLEEAGSDFDLSAALQEFESLQASGLNAADAIEEALSGIGDRLHPIAAEDILSDAALKNIDQAADAMAAVEKEMMEAARAAETMEAGVTESFGDVAEAARKMQQEVARTPEELREMGRAAVDEGIKAGEGFSTAAEGALTFARGITFLGITSESELGSVVEQLAKIQGGIDLVKGGVQTFKGLAEGARAFSAAAKAASASSLAMTAALGPLAIAGGAVALIMLNQKESFDQMVGSVKDATDEIPNLTDALDGLAETRQRLASAFDDPLHALKLEQGTFDDIRDFRDRADQIIRVTNALTDAAESDALGVLRDSFAALDDFSGRGLEQTTEQLRSFRKALDDGRLLLGTDASELFPSDEELERLGSATADEWLDAFTKRMTTRVNTPEGLFVTPLGSMRSVLEAVANEDPLEGIQDAHLKRLGFVGEITDQMRETAKGLLEDMRAIEELTPEARMRTMAENLELARDIITGVNEELNAGNLTAAERNEILREGQTELRERLGIHVDEVALLESQKLLADIQVGQTRELLEAHQQVSAALEKQFDRHQKNTLELGKQFETVADAKAAFLEGFGALDAQERQSIQDLLRQAADAGVETLTEAQANRLKELGQEAGGQLADAANAVLGRRLALTVDQGQADELIKSLQDLDAELGVRFDTNLIAGDLQAALEEVQAKAKDLEIPVKFIPGELAPAFKQFVDLQADLMKSLDAQQAAGINVDAQQSAMQEILKRSAATREALEKQIAEAAAADADVAVGVLDAAEDLRDSTRDTNRALKEVLRGVTAELSEIQQELGRFRDDQQRGRGM